MPLGIIELLKEESDHSFTITGTGALFASAHPNSLRSSCLWEEGGTISRARTHLHEIVKDGGVDGIFREFGRPAFELMASKPDEGHVFNEAMKGYSSRETAEDLKALSECDASCISTLCDIGRGFGHLL